MNRIILVVPFVFILNLNVFSSKNELIFKLSFDEKGLNAVADSVFSFEVSNIDSIRYIQGPNSFDLS